MKKDYIQYIFYTSLLFFSISGIIFLVIIKKHEEENFQNETSQNIPEYIPTPFSKADDVPVDQNISVSPNQNINIVPNLPVNQDVNIPVDPHVNLINEVIEAQNNAMYTYRSINYNKQSIINLATHFNFLSNELAKINDLNRKNEYNYIFNKLTTDLNDMQAKILYYENSLNFYMTYQIYPAKPTLNTLTQSSLNQFTAEEKNNIKFYCEEINKIHTIHKNTIESELPKQEYTLYKIQSQIELNRVLDNINFQTFYNDFYNKIFGRVLLK